MNYLDITFNEEIRPKTEYPNQLVQYLCDRYKLTEGSSLLEVGCGRGDFVNGFTQAGLTCHAVDILDRHPDIDASVMFHKVDIVNDKLPFPDNSMDVVFAKAIIEHLWDPTNFVNECKRVLKGGGIGKLLLMTPDWKSFIYRFYDDYTHVRPYTIESIQNRLISHGFINVKSELFYQLPILWKRPYLKCCSKLLQLFGPPKKGHKCKFIQFSRSLMILASGEKD